MGFLCMSPNGPLYGQNVWAMRIYASPSYSAPRRFTPTNSLHSPPALKKSLGECEFFLSIWNAFISTRGGWDVIPRDRSDCRKLKVRSDEDGWERNIQKRRLRKNPKKTVQKKIQRCSAAWVEDGTTENRAEGEHRDESNHHGLSKTGTFESQEKWKLIRRKWKLIIKERESCAFSHSRQEFQALSMGGREEGSSVADEKRR